MLKSIFLSPGRVLCGQSLSAGSRHRRYRLSSFRQHGPVLFLSVLFWVFLAGLGVTLCVKLGTNVDPPTPPPKVTANPSPTPSTNPGTPSPSAPANLVGPNAPALANASVVAPASGPEGAPLGANGQVAAALSKPPEIWLVIVESIPKAHRSEAERALARHKKKGLDLEILDTDAFPRLKSGLWALANGPFDTKKEAEAAALILKPKVKGLMVRRGL